MTVLPAFWRKHFLAFEAVIVVLLTLGFAVWYFLWEGSATIDGLLRDNRGNIYKTAATIAASLLGFSMTSTSIISLFHHTSVLSCCERAVTIRFSGVL